MEYNFSKIEKKWRKIWEEKEIFKAENQSQKPKFYILDMFPYPSGAGLHVGHPLGYIASDIYARYKRHCGFNVLHPMGYDAFGLPAEQYAIETGQHPAKTTKDNIAVYRAQLDKIGFSFDWSREVRTCEPDYYHWTQWVFIQMFNSYYDSKKNKAQNISVLIKELEKENSDWKNYSEKEREDLLQNYRLAYLRKTQVNWCPQLGTVLANDEIQDGLSIRGGHLVEQKLMWQWSLRISVYAHRLLDDLEKLDWPESVKEIQRHWIGRSFGAQIFFPVKGSNQSLEIFTTRPDTIFGVTFMVLAPESDYVQKLTTSEHKAAVEDYLKKAKAKRERERIADVENISGVFTGSYCLHPITQEEIPIWIGDYVLGNYGTGMIMAVPAHDDRDYRFAKHFKLKITPVIEGGDIQKEAYTAKEGKMINSESLNGLNVESAIKKIIELLEKKNLGVKKVQYRLRDAIFARQRYWGEPIPIYFQDGIPKPLEFDQLPLELPEVDNYLPTSEGLPPLARIQKWKNKDGYSFEVNTMPGFAGSSAYYLRYMDPQNKNELVSRQANTYWKNVDLYVGGSEHATGHLIYSRFWNKFLYDLDYICQDEPFRKMINQGMIQGRSQFIYRLQDKPNTFVSKGLAKDYKTQKIRIDVKLAHNDILDMESFRKWRKEFHQAEFILEKGDIFRCDFAIEKMSKSFFNVVNPDDIIGKYGADVFRLYEMFLGPVEQSKPWNTQGIEGVSRFLNKFWKLCIQKLSQENPSSEELKELHTCLKKVQTDIENFSFNTAISSFMICTNNLIKLKTNKEAIIKPLIIALAPFTPFICEELWEKLEQNGSICEAPWPDYNPEYMTQDSCTYAISFNGKTRFTLEFPTDIDKKEIEKEVMAHEKSQKYLENKKVIKIIVVTNKIVNIVLK